ncbi:hypothetical protein L0F63_003719 [Massospora cicadina]|nr:hypothetical protein L0F63_003719 [Massospora cicadina]
MLGVVAKYSDVSVCHPNLRRERKDFYDMSKHERSQLFEALRGCGFPLSRETIITCHGHLRMSLMERGYEGALPYWDSSRYSQIPSRDLVFTTGNFGRKADWRGCIENGILRDCLKRNKRLFNSTFVSREAIELLYLTASTQKALDTRIRYGLFSKVTIAISHNVAQALNDPIHLLHLAFIDKLWYDWQKRKFNSFQYFKAYDVKPWNIPRLHLIDPMSHLCYYYKESIHTWEPHLKLADKFILKHIKHIEYPKNNAYSIFPILKGRMKPKPKRSKIFAPASYDKSNLCNLRLSDSLPIKYIRHNNYNSKLARYYKNQEARLITALNLHPKYISSSAILSLTAPKLRKKCLNSQFNKFKKFRLVFKSS